MPVGLVVAVVRNKFESLLLLIYKNFQSLPFVSVEIPPVIYHRQRISQSIAFMGCAFHAELVARNASLGNAAALNMLSTRGHIVERMYNRCFDNTFLS